MESRQVAMTVQLMDHLAPVHKPEVLLVTMTAYDLVLGFPWFKTSKPEIDWASGQLTSLKTATGKGEAYRPDIIVQWYEGRYDESINVQLPDIGGSTLTITLMLVIPVDSDGQPRESS
jgi:hypothetical protein